MGDVLSGEFKTPLSASIAFVQTNAVWANPKPLYKQKEQTRKTKNLVCLLFFLLVMFLLTQK